MTYQFRCEICGEFEVERPMKEETLKNCITPGCKGKIVQLFKSPLVKWNCGGSYGQSKHN